MLSPFCYLVVKAAIYTLGYFCLLLSLFIFVSWSGGIFEPLGFVYLFGVYVGTSLLSTIRLVHVGYCHYQWDVNAWSNSNKSETLTVLPRKKIFYVSILTLCMVLIYPLMFLLLFANKQSVLGWQVYYIPSDSMTPTLSIGDVVLADTRSGILQTITKQDIIIFTSPLNNGDLLREQGVTQSTNTFYIKRVVATQGDIVAILNHQFLVNNEVIQPYVMQEYLAEQMIDENHVYVLGDNVNYSSDSRLWGQLLNNNIEGKFVRVIFRQQ